MIDIYNNFYKGKKVLVTGHTGFKGSWLSIWLHELGAEVVGVGSGGTNSGSGEDVTRGDAIGTLLIRGGDVGVGKK